MRAFVLERLKDGVCSSDGIADPVADQYGRHERANISTDDVGADIAIADIPSDTVAHVRRCSLPTAVHLMHCLNRPDPSVQEGPLRGARWAATNAPPTTFALSTRAPVGARRPLLARPIPMKRARPTLPAPKAATFTTSILKEKSMVST